MATPLYADIETVAEDSRFQGRCLYALAVAAGAALVEANTTLNHQARVDFARKVIAGGIDGKLLARALLTISNLNSTLNAVNISTDAGMTDAQIQTAVTNSFNVLAGVAS